MEFIPCDIRQTSQYAEYMQSIGWKTENFSNGQAFIRQIPLVGSIIKIQHNAIPIPFAEIDALAKKNRCSFLKMEPYFPEDKALLQQLKLHQFKPDNFPLLPSKTIKINLIPNETTLLRNLEKDTRNLLNRTFKNNLSVKTSKDSPQVTREQFVTLWQQNAKEKHFNGASDTEIGNLYEYFKQGQSELIFIFKPDSNEPLAGALIMNNPAVKTSHYMHAFSTLEGRKQNASYRLLWESILYAKTKFNSKIFDLEGIYDERYPQSTKHWQGFTLFKKGFGGETYTYIGSFTKYYNPLFKIFSLLP